MCFKAKFALEIISVSDRDESKTKIKDRLRKLISKRPPIEELEKKGIIKGIKLIFTVSCMEGHSEQKCNLISTCIPLDRTSVPLDRIFIPLERTSIPLDRTFLPFDRT